MSRYRLILRAVLEARAPISIASGDTDPRFDVLLVRDANGLPTLPGTSVAGMLRHVVGLLVDAETVEGLFGRAKAGSAGNGTEASALTVSGGLVHDGHDRPVDGLRLGEEAAHLDADVLVRALRDVQPVKRDHVRISGFGVAADTGKFDRAGVPRGTRFTLQLELATHERDDPRWEVVLNALAHPLFRLGGGTRNGYGDVSVVRAFERRFDLANRPDIEALAHASRLDEPLRGGELRKLQSADATAVTVIRTTLVPKDAWRYGQDGTPRETAGGQEVPHLVAVRETAIAWRRSGQGESGTLLDEDVYVLPGSSIKGALRHRTLFHLYRLKRVFEDADAAALEAVEAAASTLFGRVEGDALAGCIAVSDAVVEGDFSVGTLWHNGIDRFAGGVRAGVLYGEELVFGGVLPLTLVLTERAALEASVRLALRLALEDLAAGRLSLGAGAAKGHGAMTAPEMASALSAAKAWFGPDAHA